MTITIQKLIVFRKGQGGIKKLVFKKNPGGITKV